MENYEEIMTINEDTEIEEDEVQATKGIDPKSTIVGALGTAAIYGAYRGIKWIVRKAKAKKAEHVVETVPVDANGVQTSKEPDKK